MASDVPKKRPLGERDAQLPEARLPKVQLEDDLHEQACAAGQDFYVDPGLGLWVTTRVAHLKRGFCCGNGCRHCPFEHSAVK